MTPQTFAKSIAIVESGDRSFPPPGDGGRAMGRYQMHPDFVFEWSSRLRIIPFLMETWDAYFTRLVQGYFIFRMGQALTAVQAAVSFHVGHLCHESDDGWDADYASRFADAARSLPDP